MYEPLVSEETSKVTLGVPVLTVCEATSEPSVVRIRTRTELAELGTPLMATFSVLEAGFGYVRTVMDDALDDEGGVEDDDDDVGGV
jgi:hypothetical protein